MYTYYPQATSLFEAPTPPVKNATIMQKKGFKMYRPFHQFIEYLFYKNMANMDTMLLVTGFKGVGKSTFGLQAIRDWLQLIGRVLDFDRYIAYNNSQVQFKIGRLRPFEPILCDEAIRFASAADWAKAENKELKRKLGQVRTKHMLYILCFPLKASKLESNYLDSYVNYWIHVVTRGLAIVFVRDENPENDTWNMRGFKELGSFTEFTEPDRIIHKMERHPNYWATLKFPELPLRYYRKYAALRDSYVYGNESVAANLSKYDIARSAIISSFYDYLKNDDGFTDKKLRDHATMYSGTKITPQQFKSVLAESEETLDILRSRTHEGG